MDRINFNALIDKESFEQLNDEFTKAKCTIMYSDLNRNNSSMSKEVVDNALYSLYNIPVVGEWKESNEDFGTHGGKIEIDDQGMRYIDTTKPFGLVPESCNPRWEMVEDEDGNTQEYLVADIILWSGRYPELEATIDSYSNQSMEILVHDGKYTDDEVFVVDKFEFSALCLLGKDVEPCFEEAKVVAYSIDEFKKSLFELKAEYEKYQAINEETEAVIETQDIVEDDVVEKAFVTYREKREIVQNALDPIIVRDDEDNVVAETYFWISDMDDEYVYVERYFWSDKDIETTFGRFAYDFSDENRLATLTSEFEEMVVTWLTIEENAELEANRTALNNTIAELNDDLEIKSNELVELQEFKQNIEKSAKIHKIMEVLEEFEAVLGENEEFLSLKDDVENIDSVEILENQLYAIEGKMRHEKKVKKNKKNKTQYNFVPDEIEIEPVAIDDKSAKIVAVYGIDGAKLFNDK